MTPPPLRRVSLFALILVSVSLRAEAQTDEQPKRIHVIVALCDNATQGIQPVGKRIGDGDKPDDNLYWGCSDGLREWFKKSANWTLEKTERADLAKDPDAKILRILTFKHRSGAAILIAEAWRGRNIREATLSYFDKLIDSSDTAPDFVAYIGHNGLMDFSLPSDLSTATEKPKDTAVLCCRSRPFFDESLVARQASPMLMTEQLMYPGSFLLEAALEGWMKGETTEQLRDRAARAYQKNQKISFRAARGIFSDL